MEGEHRHDIDAAFYRLTVAQRNHAWAESARHKAERDEARAALAASEAARERLVGAMRRVLDGPCTAPCSTQSGADCDCWYDQLEAALAAQGGGGAGEP